MDECNGHSGLHSAAARGDLFMVRMCLKKGVPVDIRDEHNNTPLHHASKEGCLKAVQVLVENKAMINAINLEGSTALHESCRKGSLAVVKYLLENKASVFLRNENGETPLHVAEVVEVVEILIKYGAVVNASDYDEFTALHNNCSNLQITKLLLKNGASMHMQSLYGDTPVSLLLSCAINGNIKKPIMDLFLEEGLDVNFKDRKGFSLLHNAVIGTDAIITQYLLDHGADVDAKDPYGRTVLDFAGERRLWELIYVLYKHILKLKVAKVEVKEDIESIILTSEKIIEMDKARELCNLEIEKMKSALVEESISIHSLLLDSPRPYFLQDESLLNSLEEVLQSPSFLEEYPIYGYTLRNILKTKKQSRFHLLYLATKSFMSDRKKVHWRYLPDLVRDKIFYYLSDKDLQMFSESI